LTNRDLRFIENYSIVIKDVMTSENLITGKDGTTLEEAQKVLQKYKIEKLPLVDDDNVLRGLITIKDIEKVTEYPFSSKDEDVRLLVVDAVGVTNEEIHRIEILVINHIDMFIIDTDH